MTTVRYDDWGYAVDVPATTPSGEAVNVQEAERGGMHMVQAETEDQSEFYFEVLSCEGLRDHAALAAEQRRFIIEHAASGEPTEAAPGQFGQLAGTTFRFEGQLQGKLKKRIFLFTDGPGPGNSNRTYRIVHDPRSALNTQALAGFRFLN